jgi:hypothetical protein
MQNCAIIVPTISSKPMKAEEEPGFRRPSGGSRRFVISATLLGIGLEQCCHIAWPLWTGIQGAAADTGEPPLGPHVLGLPWNRRGEND